MFIISGKIEISPAFRTELIAAIDSYVAQSRGADGNLAFRITEDMDQSGTFYIYEEWKTVQARGRHTRAACAQAFRRSLADIQVLSIQLSQYEARAVS